MNKENISVQEVGAVVVIMWRLCMHEPLKCIG